jgi:hypothetical protein
MAEFNHNRNQEDVWQTNTCRKINRAFEIMSKRRKGFPSETHVKKGERVVHGDKELREKLGRNDPCPCGSGRTFKNCCLRSGRYDGTKRNHFFPRMTSAPGDERKWFDCGELDRWFVHHCPPSECGDGAHQCCDGAGARDRGVPRCDRRLRWSVGRWRIQHHADRHLYAQPCGRRHQAHQNRKSGCKHCSDAAVS